MRLTGFVLFLFLPKRPAHGGKGVGRDAKSGDLGEPVCAYFFPQPALILGLKGIHANFRRLCTHFMCFYANFMLCNYTTKNCSITFAKKNLWNTIFYFCCVQNFHDYSSIHVFWLQGIFSESDPLLLFFFNHLATIFVPYNHF